MTEQAQREDARYLAYWRLQPLLRSGKGLEVAWANGEIRSAARDDPGAVLLGLRDQVPYFAVDVSDLEKPERELGVIGVAEFSELRTVAGQLAPGEGAILAHGRSLLDWHATHRFCPACGESTEVGQGGVQRVCTGCDREHFPRLHPVVIMAVVREGKCLVGRQRGWPASSYSTLAGFVEPGETLEEAVGREVWEEVGIRVTSVRYVFSQPWPFPAQLMLGCIAEAASSELQLDRHEIDDARWIEREPLRAALQPGAQGDVQLPPPMAIAHHLLKHWIEER